MGISHSNWRIAGLAVGVLAIIYSSSISFIAFDLELLINRARYLIIYLAVISFHFLSCVSWLLGIIKERPTLMELPLLWWAVHLGISACFLIGFTLKYPIVENIYQYLIECTKLVILTICYFITVKCYISTREVANVKSSRIDGYNVTYVVEERNRLSSSETDNKDL